MNAANKKKPSYIAKQKIYAAKDRQYSAKPQPFLIPVDMPENERARAYANAYYHANKDRMKKPDKERRRIYMRKWQRKFNKTTNGSAISFMRKCVARCLDQKRDRTSILLGYSKEELISHIESLFKDGMTWENRGEWHIDHIIPVVSFIERGERDPSVVNALSNLRPLWASENLAKGKKHDAV